MSPERSTTSFSCLFYRYAQLLTTTFVTLTYASGMPILYLFAFFYMGLMYWADKLCLLWYSKPLARACLASKQGRVDRETG